MPSIYIGYDPKESAEFAVARESVEKHALKHWPVYGLVLSRLKDAGIYTRPTEFKPSVDGPIMWDVISDAPMSTEHANARFLVPHLEGQGWALFMDGDMMVRDNLCPLFASLDRKYAVYCVKHDHRPATDAKMGGQIQTKYARKNWSSFMIFNCDYQANRDFLTVENVNRLPGRDLHRFCWLNDDEIGELDPAWNFLVGHSNPKIEPKCIHWTSGTPAMKGYENVPFADEWRSARDSWAVGRGPAFQGW